MSIPQAVRRKRKVMFMIDLAIYIGLAFLVVMVLFGVGPR